MVRLHHEIILETLPAYIDASDQLHVQGLDISLPCSAKQEHCRTDRYGTFLWKQPTGDDTCPLHLSRGPLRGMDVTDSAGSTSFITNDGSDLRLEKKDPVSRCGEIVYRTDFPSLYLTKALDHRPFNRPLHASDLSAILYSNVKDAYLHSVVVSNQRKEFAQRRRKRCKADAARRADQHTMRMAEQGALLDGETASLGNGNFISAAGEVYYSFQCRPVTVRARTVSNGKCYVGLPVALGEADYHMYLRAVGMRKAEANQWKMRTKGGPDDAGSKEEPAVDDEVDAEPPFFFFLEPRTHRITEEAITAPCSYPFLPLYKNVHNRWVAYAGNEYRVAASPTIINSDKSDLHEVLDNKVPQHNWAGGGIYDYDTIRRLRRWRDRPAIGAHVGPILWDQGRQHAWQVGRGGQLRAHELFPDMPDLSTVGSSAFSHLSNVWWFFETYGTAMSILVGTTIVGRFLSWLMGVITRLFTMPLHGNLILHVVTAFFPSAREVMANPGRFCQNLFKKKRGSYSPEAPSYYNVEVSEAERKARKEKKRQDWEKYQTEMADAITARSALMVERTILGMAGGQEGGANANPIVLPAGFSVREEMQKAAQEVPLPYPALPK